jgi:hypothetical protein
MKGLPVILLPLSRMERGLGGEDRRLAPMGLVFF